MVSLVVDWFVRLGGVGMAGAIFHPTVARFDPIAKVEVDARWCHGENRGKMPSLEVFPPKRLGLYFWLNDLTGWTGKPSLRGCNAVGWFYGR